jgi:hypothetical protein
VIGFADRDPQLFADQKGDPKKGMEFSQFFNCLSNDF